MTWTIGRAAIAWHLFEDNFAGLAVGNLDSVDDAAAVLFGDHNAID